VFIQHPAAAVCVCVCVYTRACVHVCEKNLVLSPQCKWIQSSSLSDTWSFQHCLPNSRVCV